MCSISIIGLRAGQESQSIRIRRLILGRFQKAPQKAPQKALLNMLETAALRRLC